MESFILELERITHFNFRRSGGTFFVSSDDMADAKDFHGDNPQHVKVIHWFDDFWLYIKVSLGKIEIISQSNEDKKKERAWHEDHSLKINSDFFTIVFTLSVFQGARSDSSKAQLFRAEWDNYEQVVEHPQPHWQIYPYKYDQAAGLQSAADFNALIGELRVGDSFEQSLTSDHYPFLPIQQFHFAMHGDWAMNNTHHHRILNVSSLGNWLNGMKSCIENQIRFLQNSISN